MSILKDQTDEKAESLVKNEPDITRLQHELEWASEYRALVVQNARKCPIKPKHSPINIPFKICRYEQELSSKMRKESRKVKTRKKKSAKESNNNPSLMERSAMSQTEYDTLLAKPNPNFKGNGDHESPITKKKRKRCCRCELEPCPPRLVQMAVPNKRYVLENWKSYQHFLPAEILLRFDRILRSGNNSLEPKEARYYFKQIDKRHKKELRKKRKLKKKLKDDRLKGDKMWMFEQIDETCRAIWKHLDAQPSLALNYDQLVLSDEFLDILFSNKLIKKAPIRTTKNTYLKTIIETSDKLARLLDYFGKEIEARPLDSEEELSAFEISSLESLLGEELLEGEEGLLSEDEEQLTRALELAAAEGESLYDLELDQKLLLDKAKDFLLHEGEGSTTDFLGQLDEDMLEKLIQILSNCPEEFLNEMADAANWPGVTYGDILAKLKELRDKGKLDFERNRQPILLEQVMIDWARKNNPEKVDAPILDKIQETSAILADWLRFEGASLAQARGQGTKEGEEGEDEEGRRGGKTGDDEDDEESRRRREEGADHDADRLALEGADADDSLLDALGGAGGKDDTFNMDDSGLGTSFEDSLLDPNRLVDDLLDKSTAGKDDAETSGRRPGDEDEDESLRDIIAELTPEELAALEDEEDEGLLGQEGEEGGAEDLLEGDEGSKLRGKEDEELLIDEARLVSRDSLLMIIRGHKPSVVFEHSPDTICCLSLKIWAIWLLEIANNAHNWTRWIGDIVRQIKNYAAIIRGDVRMPNGERKILYKEEWRRFTKETEDKIVQWRAYSKHVKDLSNEIVETFHGKKVTCCPKCLQDHLIKNVVTAHDTLEALTEAINCAGYWQRCLDRIVEQTSKLTDIGLGGGPSTGLDQASADLEPSEESFDYVDFVDITHAPQVCTPRKIESEESIWEIEELDP